jgi:hypothetical protein
VEVALFITCLDDTLFPGTGRATETLLERPGCTVAFPEERTCCGQMHANAATASTRWRSSGGSSTSSRRAVGDRARRLTIVLAADAARRAT